jgi:CheY-like chemotaxis protein
VAERKKLGEILVERGILCSKSVERVLAVSKKMNKRLGVVLEEMGLVTGKELAEALAVQHGCKVVFNFAGASFPPQLLGIITPDTALQNLIFPLKLEQGKLHMAVSDPTGLKVLKNISANNGVTVIPYVTPRSDIKAAICKHYLGVEMAEPTRQTVLIAEDDKMLLTLLKNVLSKEYQVVTATDGMDAFKEAISKKPHVIVTDMEMPKLDGFGLLDALRSVPETKAIPVILVSGTTSAEAESKAFERGFFDFIPKPAKEATIVTRVKRAFDFARQDSYLFLR